MANPHADTRPPNRTERVTVRLGETELERISLAAERRGIAPSVLMRAAALDAAGVAQPASPIAEAPQVPARELVELRAAINRVGNNINQIARLGNRDRALSISGRDAEVFSDMVRLLREVRAVLGGSR